MAGDDLTGNRQTEAGTAGRGARDAVKAFEDPRQVLGRNAFARIRHGEADEVAVILGGEANRPAPASVSARILGGWLADPAGSYPGIFGPGGSIGGKEGVKWLMELP